MTKLKYTPEIRERSVQLLIESEKDYPSTWAAITAIAEWSRSNQWLKLDVVQANEKLDKNHAMVEFKAHYHDGTSPQIHHEISHFVKHAEAWYFLDPTTEMQINMKQACVCGSGKKFKQCCAQFL